MWAWKRVDQLLKQADRDGHRGSELTDEIVRLGEDYSIVTEYTSFLVLENDGEYQRWKIERKNMRRLDRDRGAQKRRKETLNTIRAKAVRDIGPESAKKKMVSMAPKQQNVTPVPQVSSGPSSTPAPRRQSWNLNFGGGGGGPVGPLFIGLTCWLRRKKKNRKVSENKEIK